MKEWLVLCPKPYFEIEKRRFQDEKAVQVYSMTPRNIARAKKHLDNQKPVLCEYMLEKKLLEANNLECLYFLLDENPITTKQMLEKIDNRIHLLYMDQVYAKVAEERFGRDCHFIEPDLKCLMPRRNLRAQQKRVLLVGNYLNPEDGEAKLREHSPELFYPIVKKVTQKSKMEYQRRLDEIVAEVFAEEKLKYTSEIGNEFIDAFQNEIETYHERKDRHELAYRLIAEGVHVNVIGEHWDVFRKKLPEELQENLTIVCPVLVREIIVEAMKDMEVVVVIDRSRKYGMSMWTKLAKELGGEIVVPQTEYTEKVAHKDKQVYLYNPNRLSGSVRQIKKILDSDKILGCNTHGEGESFLVSWMKTI
ncbi:MAG: hypothetical protein E7280_01030 [Lachnospiraceae bacterium]|nr:hypothetical protein [Lachnospiraceae bacterium]